ncbi:bifunctional adenosylcobinamide kinase/adenosylcobinamide-phosphate guanylyltransferase [Nitrospira sp. Kam-Ns4a]
MAAKSQRPTPIFPRPPSYVPRSASRGRLILVVGGSASGKSAAALRLAVEGLPRGSARAFVATGQPLDAEMAERIRRHRAERDAGWQTEEVPVELAAWFQKYGRAYRAIVLDCITLWLSNLCERGAAERRIPTLVTDLLRTMRDTRARTVLVTNELGWGVVPMSAAARRFRDLAGRVNQQLAAAADEVYLVVAGQALRLK